MARKYTPRKSPGGGNFLHPSKVARIKTMVSLGWSLRRIAKHIPCSQRTVRVYRQIFTEHVPTCRHGKPIYNCVSCIAGRHSKRPLHGIRRNAGDV